MVKTDTSTDNGLLAEVSPAPDRTSFVRRALAYVVRRAGGTGGSVFVHDPASGKLRLQVMLDATTGEPVDPPLVELAPGEGAGRVPCARETRPSHARTRTISGAPIVSGVTLLASLTAG